MQTHHGLEYAVSLTAHVGLAVAHVVFTPQSNSAGD